MAELLLGMVRAFYHAGARALPVAHWEVSQNAAVKLTMLAVRGSGENVIKVASAPTRRWPRTRHR